MDATVPTEEPSGLRIQCVAEAFAWAVRHKEKEKIRGIEVLGETARISAQRDEPSRLPGPSWLLPGWVTRAIRSRKFFANGRWWGDGGSSGPRAGAYSSRYGESHRPNAMAAPSSEVRAWELKKVATARESTRQTVVDPPGEGKTGEESLAVVARPAARAPAG